MAKLGRAADAEKAFDDVIEAAVACRFRMWEMFARRDLVEHVLDGAGRRDEQYAALGGVIERMVLPASGYTEALDCAGLDAEDAVAAYKASL